MKIKVNSKKVVKGDTFIALGKGHNYIDEAISNGASKVVCEYGSYDVETLVVPNTHEYLCNYLKENYYDKIKDLKLIGMTGTNGKTTTCYLLYQALNNSNIRCAYIGTIGFYMDSKVRDLNNTTPDIYELYEMLLECVEYGYTHVVMEVSSIALSLNRVETLKFDIAVFTNLTIDHLDFHKNMEDYALAKQKLFKMLKTDGMAFINNDSDYKNYFMFDKYLTYGFSKSDYTINSYSLNMSGTSFKVNGNSYHMSLIGRHNLYNMCVVIAILDYLNVNSDISVLLHPKGRMDLINYQDNLIVVDYAHTPDAVLNVINTVKEIDHNHIYTLIGCGGNRDKSKRSVMADIATKYCTKAIFTSDNPRREKPEDILEDMVRDIKQNNYEIAQNRKEAIRKGIQMLEKNDILLVLGKGHETYQIIGDVKYPFDDKEIILDIIRS